MNFSGFFRIFHYKKSIFNCLCNCNKQRKKQYIDIPFTYFFHLAYLSHLLSLEGEEYI